MNARRGMNTFAVVVFAAAPARAYRPFDSTDADVAARGEIELELGPVGYLRQGGTNFVAPTAIFNLGFVEDWELVLQGRAITPSMAGDGSRLGLDDTGAFLKSVLREGSLQGRSGPSVATEFGALLPTVHDEPGAGFSWAFIFSERLAPGTLHLNLLGARTRAGNADLFAGLILEGPFQWTVRPVAELVYEREFDALTTRSALAGVIGRFADNLALDAGVRYGSLGGTELVEVRGGLTWAFPAWR